MKKKIFFLSVLAATIIMGFVGYFHRSPLSVGRADGNKTLNLSLRANITGLDPVHLNDAVTATVVVQIFESLYEYHYLKRPLELIPALAEAMPTISKDGLVYRINLRKGVYFHDDVAFPGGRGRELNASDVVYSYKRLLDPKMKSEAAFAIDNKIVGAKEWSLKVSKDRTQFDNEIPGLRVLGSNTIEIRLLRPFPQLIHALAFPGLSIVAREVIERYGDESINHPVGTGPFKLSQATDWIRNSKITLRKNPNYRDFKFPSEGTEEDQILGRLDSKGQRLPFLDKLTFSELIEDQPRWQNAMQGKIDIFDIPNDNYTSAIENKTQLSRELRAMGLQLEIFPESGLLYLGFNFEDPIWGKSVLLRKAVSLALDKKKYIEVFLNGRGILAEGIVPPLMPEYDSGYKSEMSEFDVAKAKTLLVKAGFPGGAGLPPLVFDTLSNSKARQVAEFIQMSLAEIGIKVEMRANTFGEILNKMKEKKMQFWALGWSAVYPDIEAMTMAFYSKNVSPGPNIPNYSNPVYDQLYLKSASMTPSLERTRIVNQMRDMIKEEVPWIPIAHRMNYQLIQPWVKNYKPHPNTQFTFKYLDVDDKEKAQRRL